MNLSLGFFSFIFLSTFHGAIQGSFEARSRALLTADFSISAQRELKKSEEEILSQILLDHGIMAAQISESRSLETFSMLATLSGGASKLVEVHAIQGSYPLYGQFKLDPTGVMKGGVKKNLNENFSAWISPEIALQMGLKRGDPIRIGSSTFHISDVIIEDSGSSWRGGALAPRVYVGLEQFPKTGLIQKGSRINFKRHYRIAEAEQNEAKIRSIAAELNRRLSDPEIRVRTHTDAGEQAGRVLNYLRDFLGLVAMVGLFLSALGAAYLFQSFVSRRFGEIATLKCLGLSSMDTQKIYVIHLVVLGSAAVALAYGLAIAALSIVSPVIERHLDFGILPYFNALAILPALAVGLAGSILTCLPFLAKIGTLKPTLLFQEGHNQEAGTGRPSFFVFIPAILFFYGMSVWQAHSWRIGSFFFVGMALSGIFLATTITFILKIPSVSKKRAFRYLSRNRLGTVSSFIAVGLGAVLICLLPQIQKNITAEIENPESSILPSLFLFDIQDEQTEAVGRLLQNFSTQHSQMSPMIRARLLTVNRKPFEKADRSEEVTTREDEQSARSRNRGTNLTYRQNLSAAETLDEGVTFTGPYAGTGIPEISIERRFAERMNLKLSDVLLFDVQGIEVSGRIVNIRKVKWTTFQPNFFIVFQPGVLEDAPKTHLATVQRLNTEMRAKVQNQIVREFPNISIVDVTQLITKLMELFEQMAIALRLMAALSVITGLAVLYSIATDQAQNRRTEVQLLKVLGASQMEISRMFWLEFGSIGLLASSIGVTASTALSYATSALFFDSAWSFTPWIPVLVVVGITLLTLLTTQIAMRRTLQEKPARLLAGSP
jgi:putative ABC transport system permease protein